MTFSTSVILPEGEVKVSRRLSYGDLLAIHGMDGYSLANVISTGPRVKVQSLGEAESFAEPIDNFIPITVYAGGKQVPAYINGIELSLLECGQSTHLKVQKGKKVRAFRVIDVRGTIIEAKELKVHAVVG